MVQSRSDRLSVMIRLCSSGIARSPLRRPDSTWTSGTLWWWAAKAPAKVASSPVFEFDNGVRMASAFIKPDQLGRYRRNAVVLHEPKEENRPESKTRNPGKGRKKE